MTTATAGPPSPVALTLTAHAGVQFDGWLTWVDATNAAVDLSGHQGARLVFGPARSWETVPSDVDTTTNAATVGRITLAATAPNMKIAIPLSVMADVDFRRLHYVLEVTDPAGVTRRWAEGDMTLDRADV